MVVVLQVAVKVVLMISLIVTAMDQSVSMEIGSVMAHLNSVTQACLLIVLMAQTKV